MGIFDAPENIRKTRNGKFNAENDCYKIIQTAEYLIKYSQNIPEEDNAEHTALVEKFASCIHSARLILEQALEVGRE